MGRWGCWLLGLALLLAGCAPRAASTPTGTPIPAVPTQSPTTIARPAPSPSLLATPGTPIAASPTVARPTATVAATPTSTIAAARNANVTVLASHTGPVGVIAWSPDGSRFATSSGTGGSPDQTVRLWKADGTPLVVLPATNLTGRALAWSPDGRTLATSAADGATRLWTAEGVPLGTLAAEPDPVLNLAWSPDGQTLAVGAFVAAGSPTARAFSGVVRLWRPDGRLLVTMRTEMTGGKFLHLFWSRDGAMLAGGAIDFSLWRADGTVVATLRQGGTPAPAMDRSPRGDRIAIGDENGVLVVLTGEGRPFNAARESTIRQLAFSPDGRTLAVFSDRGVSLLDMADPAAAPRLIRQFGQMTYSNLAWSPDGTRFAAATPEGIARVWDADGTPRAILEGCLGEILRVAWSPDGRALVAGSQKGAVCIWRV